MSLAVERASTVVFRAIERRQRTILWFRIDPDGVLRTEDLSAVRLPDHVPHGGGIVFAGVGPIWLYCHLVEMAAESGDFVWVGTFEPRAARAVIAWTSDPAGHPVGAFVPSLDEPADLVVSPGPSHELSRPVACHAVAVVGPPHSGKSVFIAGLQRLLRGVPRAWVYRTTPDGEGLWSQEADADHVQRIRHKFAWTEDLCRWNTATVRLLKESCDLLFIDTGGKPSEDTAALLDVCGKAVILAAQDEGFQETLAEWRAFCTRSGAEVIAELGSDLAAAATRVCTEGNPISGTVAGLDRSNGRPEQQVELVLKAICSRLNLIDFA